MNTVTFSWSVNTDLCNSAWLIIINIITDNDKSPLNKD